MLKKYSRRFLYTTIFHSLVLVATLHYAQAQTRRVRPSPANTGASSTIARFMLAAQKRDLRAVINLVSRYQAGLAKIRSNNPSVLWPKLTNEYYDDVIRHDFVIYQSGLSGSSLARPLSVITDSCTWRISETRVGPPAVVYVTVDYPSAEVAPEVPKLNENASRYVDRRLKQTILKFQLANSQLVDDVTKVDEADVIWGIPQLSDAFALELAKINFSQNDELGSRNRLHVYIEPPRAHIESENGASPWFSIMFPRDERPIALEGGYGKKQLAEIESYQRMLNKHGLRINRAFEDKFGWAVELPEDWKKYQLRVEPGRCNRAGIPCDTPNRYFLDESVDYQIGDLQQANGEATAIAKIIRHGCNPICSLLRDYWSQQWAHDMAYINPEYDGFFYARWDGGDINGATGYWPMEATRRIHYTWSSAGGWAIDRDEPLAFSDWQRIENGGGTASENVVVKSAASEEKTKEGGPEPIGAATNKRPADRRQEGQRGFWLTIDPSVLKQSRLVWNGGPNHVGEFLTFYVQMPKERIDTTTRQPTVDIEYVLSYSAGVDSDAQVVAKQSEDFSSTIQSGDGLRISRVIDTSKLAVGIYDLQVRLTDRQTRKRTSIKSALLVTQ